MSQNSLGDVKKCLINTGNILSLNDITRKSTQNPSEELIEAVNITLKEFSPQNQNLGDKQETNNSNRLLIYRATDDLQTKLSEQSLDDLKIGLKVFFDDGSNYAISEAVKEAMNTLKVHCIHNVIVAVNKKGEKSETGKDLDDALKDIWSKLELFVKEKSINQIGVADVEESTFRKLYEWAEIKPAIIQINLATCCVVPPTLQQFCKDNEVQLLTHSDPTEMLPQSTIKDLLGIQLPIKWILRYLVHITCRGVLITKGYLINLGENQ